MKRLFPTVFAVLAAAAPAWGAEATLEGYGGDGALLVGIDSNGSPFGDSTRQQGGGTATRSAPDDGNLVAEGVAVAPGSGGQGGAAQPSPGQSAQPGNQPSRGGGERRRAGGERREGGPAGRDTAPAPQSGPATGSERSSAGVAGGVPLTGAELALLLAALLGLAAMGAGMKRLAAGQPRL